MNMLYQSLDRRLLIRSTAHCDNRIEHGDGVASAPHLQTQLGTPTNIHTFVHVEIEQQVQVVLSRFDCRHGFGCKSIIADGSQIHPTFLQPTRTHQTSSDLSTCVQKPFV